MAMPTTTAAEIAVLNGIRSLTANPPADKTIRNDLYYALKKLATVIEEPHDTIYRIVHSPKTLTLAQVASDLKIFQILAESDKLTVSDVATQAGCNVVLAGRILRFLASHDMVDEVQEDVFKANNVTRTLSVEGFQAGIRHGFQSILPCLERTPEFLKDTKYVNPVDTTNTPFQIAYKTNLPAFVWAMSAPQLVADFNLWMSVLHDGQSTWLDVFDFSLHCKGTNDHTVIFVDIGGGLGQQCDLLKQRHPDVKGRVILQELPFAIENAQKTPGVELQDIDMWQGQQVKGSKTYYMRNILHDYPDERCIELLKITEAAMSPDSVLLIDEMIIPNSGAHPRATELDIEMMVTLASMERTEKQWEALLNDAGFKALAKMRYMEGTCQSVIVAAPASRM